MPNKEDAKDLLIARLTAQLDALSGYSATLDTGNGLFSVGIGGLLLKSPDAMKSAKPSPELAQYTMLDCGRTGKLLKLDTDASGRLLEEYGFANLYLIGRIAGTLPAVSPK